MNALPIEPIPYRTRDERSRFVARRFAGYLPGGVLDVGCYEAPLRDILVDIRYHGVDIAGNPDQRINLETCTRLPFDDHSWSCVLCADVLEHLDNLHAMFDELLRVAKDYVILSLPNAWRDARRPIEKGRGSFEHYGLWLDRPIDRHKWFFNISQIDAFIMGRAARDGFAVVERFAAEKPKAGLLRAARQLRYPGERYQNRYCQTYWAVLAPATAA